MIPSRKERIQKLNESRRTEPEFTSFNLEDHFASLESEPPSSEMRFDELANHAAAFASIKDAAIALRRDARLEVKVISSASDLPKLSRDSHYKYSTSGGGSFDEYRTRMEDGEPVLVFVAQERTIVIGYALIDLGTARDGHEVKIIDVERASRRSAGFQTKVELEGQSFGIGVSHLLATSIVSHFKERLYTDATHDSSRYVFKSVGFSSYSSNNPCLLETRPR